MWNEDCNLLLVFTKQFLSLFMPSLAILELIRCTKWQSPFKGPWKLIVVFKQFQL